MKKTFIKISLTLCALLLISVPTQAFAAEKPVATSKCGVITINNCTTNQDQLQKQLQNISSKLNLDCQKALQNVKLVNGTDSAIKNKTCNKVSKPSVATKPSTTTATKPSTTATKPSTTANNTTATKPSATVSTPTANTSTTGNASNNQTSASVGAYEQQVADIVNKERAANGLPALKVNTKLSAVAEKKAEDMRDKNYFSHTSPTYGSPFDMMKQFGISYSSAGENIAKGQRTPQEVMTGWMNSPGHRANILNSSYTEIGIGYVTDGSGNTYWVQQFIRP